MLWRDMTRLGGVEWPRIVHWKSAELVPDIGCDSNNFALLGQEWFFRRPDFLSDVLDHVRVLLDFDRDNWRRQKPFLLAYASRLFGNTDLPAWITVFSARKGFGRRMQETGAKPSHAALLVGRPIRVTDLRGSDAKLNGLHLDARGLWPMHPLEHDRPMQLQRVSIIRSLAGDRGLLRSQEDRLVAVSGDPEDFNLASRGYTPLLELYRGHDDVHRSPLVNFCRLDGNGISQHRCVTFHPRTGFVGDVRAFQYTPEYYLRSGMMNHTILEWLLKPGAHERF